MNEIDYENEEHDVITQFREWLQTFRTVPYHLFVFSLSEEKSLLSQWRGYTPHEKGVSLGFSPSTLNQILVTVQGAVQPHAIGVPYGE